ncbi:MAG: AAA family ATPase [Deltaproteobacteria bacterium]|nr:AAA family ATPase [Deltaproteobacteria bacterium]
MERPWLHIRFGRFELDEAIHELRADGVPVAIQPQPLALLVLLARNRDRVVRREEIVEALWPDVTVTDDALWRTLLKAREALGEVGTTERVLRTVRGVGFRFASAVEEGPASQPVTTISAARSGPSRGASAFIGRAREQAWLDEALHAALAGSGRLVLVSGAAGIGKTRLIAELIATTRRAGVEVHEARAWEGSGVPALWPWEQVLASYAELWSPDALRSAMGEEGASELARLLPGLRMTLGVEVSSAAADGDEAQFRLFEALARFLVRAARERPQLVVLEDVHWVDAASLRALDFLAGEIASAPILVVVTCREEEIGPEHPLTHALALGARAGVLVRVPLTGLDSGEVRHLIESDAGFEPSADLVRAAHDLTGGNPFFVKQIVDLARTEQHGFIPRLESALAERVRGLPPEVHHVIRRNLAALSSDCRRLLGMAAVWGREFPLAGLVRMPGFSREELLELLGSAVEARVLELRPGPGRVFCFAHDLLRRAVYAELDPALRVQLHHQVALALEALHAAHLEPVVPSLAFHYGEAAPLLDDTKAVDYARWAGELARTALSHDEAAQHFERALAALDLRALPDPVRRAELLVCLGYACQSAGRHERGREVLREAASVARGAGAAGPLAMAAVGLAEIGTGLADAGVVSLLEDALHTFGDGSSPVRLWLTCMLAANLANLPGRLAEAERLADAAAAIARELGDARSWSVALSSRAAVQRISPRILPEERLLGLSEAADLGRAAGDASAELVARLQRYGALVELADGGEMEAELARIESLVARLRSPYWRYVSPSLRAMRHLLDGRFAEAEALIDEAFTSAEAPRIAFTAARLGNIAAIRYEQGRMAELLPLLAPLAEQFSNVAALRTAWILALLEAGRTDEARGAFEALADRAAADVVGTESWLSAIATLADICARLADPLRARALSLLLAPRTEQCIIIANGHYCQGPVALYLGMLACTEEDYDAADEALALSLARSDALRSPVWRAHTLAARARMLLARAERGDRRLAKDVASEALGIAQKLGMGRLCRELDTALRR